MITGLDEFTIIHMLPDPDGVVPLHQLHDRWSAWTAERGIPAAPLVEVVRALMACGVARPVDPVTGQYVLVGATLRDITGPS